MERKELAKSYFKEGYNCSQSVFLAYADKFGLDRDTALKLSASFGAGMGRMREVCGAVSGMFMVAGLATGSPDPKDIQGKKENYEIVQKMAEEFKKKSGGSIICHELLGLDQKKFDATPDKRDEKYYKKRPCVDLVGDACEVIDSVLKL